MRSIFRLVPIAAFVTAIVSATGADAQVTIYPPPPPYPYPASYAEADVRIVVKPREASVYVDGYYAGKVDDFDGTFQRLHVEPGQHEIAIYLKGYRTIHQQLYLHTGKTTKIEGSLELLDPGEPQEPQPRPAEPPPSARGGERAQAPPAPNRPPAPHRPAEPPRPEAPPRSEPGNPEQAPPPASQSRYATLSIRVQPAASTIYVDGERWTGPDDGERLIIQVPPGRHHIEVEHNGYVRYASDIDTERGRTDDINIALTQQR